MSCLQQIHRLDAYALSRM